nr:MAG TPA: Transketolase, pyrimidine binding domain [Caudoviricetes sp.]
MLYHVRYINMPICKQTMVFVALATAMAYQYQVI